MNKSLRFAFLLFAVFFFLLPFSAQEQLTSQEIKKAAMNIVDKMSPLLISASDAIWEYAETALLERESSKKLIDILREEGFQVESGVADLPTAFVATYGSGKPRIGILAEYDALPGLSQDKTSFKKPLLENGNGHGCGHNLLGAGCLGAALALKEVIKKHNLKGTVVLYGCPAEEAVGGKLYMARAGLFNDLDACITWHPHVETTVMVDITQAVDGFDIEFFGKSAHAAADPWDGISALDALEMTTFGINYLREHVAPSVRMHYVIAQGGRAANVVPDYAKLHLAVRDSTRAGVKLVVQKIENIVKGAALAVGCTSKINHGGSYHEMLANMSGSQVMQKNLEFMGPLSYTKEELDFARRIQKESGVEEKGMVSAIKPVGEPKPVGGSTDVAEVSWITPTLWVATSCAPSGIPWHNWAVVSSAAHAIGHKGMLYAAKAMSLTAIDLILNPEILPEMKKEFIKKLDGYVYKSGIPADQKPPLPKK